MVDGFLFLYWNLDYWDALKVIEDYHKDKSSFFSRGLRYMQGNVDSFGGNFSTRERFSYFDHQSDDVEVPCGFFKDFPVSDSGEFCALVFLICIELNI